jgi:hypothetical protein
MSSKNRALKKWLIFFLVVAIPIGCIEGCRALNRGGVCFKRGGWISDEEKMAFAITAKLQKPHKMKDRIDIGKSYILRHPNCCRIYAPEELIGQVVEIESGTIARPTYVRIFPAEITVDDGEVFGWPGNVIVSSCADEWWPWDDVPLPPDTTGVP